MSMRLIMNPASRSGRGRRRWDGWRAGLRRAGVAFEEVVTGGVAEIFEAARDPGACDVVVAVGGDGTINRVLDGVMQSGREGVRVGVLYAGTSPDFCTFHGIPTEPGAALDALIRAKSRRVDAVRICYAGGDGKERTGHFACSCNIGMGAVVASTSNALRRWCGDRPGTFLGVMRALGSCTPVEMEVCVGAARWRVGRVNNLTIAKNPHIASGLKINLDLAPDDGQLGVVTLSGRSRLGVLRDLPGFYSGDVASREGVRIERGQRVTVRSGVACEVEFDGDARGQLPVEVEVIPRAIQLLGGHDA